MPTKRTPRAPRGRSRPTDVPSDLPSWNDRLRETGELGWSRETIDALAAALGRPPSPALLETLWRAARQFALRRRDLERGVVALTKEQRQALRQALGHLDAFLTLPEETRRVLAHTFSDQCICGDALTLDDLTGLLAEFTTDIEWRLRHTVAPKSGRPAKEALRGLYANVAVALTRDGVTCTAGEGGVFARVAEIMRISVREPAIDRKYPYLKAAVDGLHKDVSADPESHAFAEEFD